MHGVIWTNHINDIVGCYQKWDSNYQEDQVTIIYDTMWQATRRMAEQIANGVRQAHPETRVVIMNVTKDDKNDILLETFRSREILVGCPTVNLGMTYAMAGMLELIHGMRFKGKKAAVFTSFGWGGGVEKRMQQRLEEAGFEIAAEPLKVKWAPDSDAERQCREWGSAL